MRLTLVQAGKQSFGASYVWVLDTSWRTRTLRLSLTDVEDRSMLLERSGPESWRVDGAPRPDLDGRRDRRFGNALLQLAVDPPLGEQLRRGGLPLRQGARNDPDAFQAAVRSSGCRQVRTIRTGDAELFTQSLGDPSDPPVLLVMGAMVSMLWWPDGFCELLAGSGRWCGVFADQGRRP